MQCSPNTDRPFSGLDSNERLLLHLIVFNFSSDPICSMFFSVLTRTAAFLKSNEQIYSTNCLWLSQRPFRRNIKDIPSNGQIRVARRERERDRPLLFPCAHTP